MNKRKMKHIYKGKILATVINTADMQIYIYIYIMEGKLTRNINFKKERKRKKITDFE